MTFSENDQEESFLRFESNPKRHSYHHFTTKKNTNNHSSSSISSQQQQQQSRSPSSSSMSEHQIGQTNSNEISWPILVAIVPTLGTFFAGSAEVWSDFVMILLILYYIYKWMTVPWSYYESARSRRIIHFNASYPSADSTGDGKKKSASRLRHEEITNELRRHELIGLIWVLASPAIAGYTLQFSRYFLSDYDKYMSSFNVVVFVLAASIKPLSHAAQLLRERTLYLQSEIQINETQVTRLQKKLDLLEDELFSLRQAFATKKDLGQVTDGLSPTLQQLTKAMKRFEKKEQSLRSWSEDRFTNLDEKLREFDQFICYQIDQEQRMSKHSTITTLILLPINITFWIAKSMTGFLPVSRALLGDASSTNDHLYRQHLDYKPATKSLPHPTTTSTRSKSSSSSSGKHITHPDIISPPTTPDPNIAH